MKLSRSSFYYNPTGKDPEQMKAEACSAPQKLDQSEC